jgi:hypothetical protein
MLQPFRDQVAVRGQVLETQAVVGPPGVVAGNDSWSLPNMVLAFVP